MKENIFERITNLLKSKEKYVSDDGELLKAKIYSDIITMDKNLLSLLLSDEEVKKAFFLKVDDALVFDKQKFAWIIDSKEFLPDSYTAYTNKIGLTSNGDFISQKNDVVLDFPYKDCVLEGGQTKDDQKRKEIFYNETLASSEIRRMLDPKVLTRAKRYTKDGIEENISFDEKDNLIIKGNNLIVLSSILERYEGQVKCIYIDPPYNTGGDSFGYNDSFNHSTWLTFMKNRLEFAKKLLKEDGVIFVQCDDNEQAYLKVLMDEVFLRENFIACAPRKTGTGAAANRANYVLRKPYDFILIYCKNKTEVKFNKKIMGTKQYEYHDELGDFMLAGFQASGSDATRESRPNLYYPIYVDKQFNLSLNKTSDSIETILPDKIRGDDGRWMWSKQKFEKDSKNYLKYDGEKIYRKVYCDKSEDQNIYQVEKAYFDETDYQNSKGTKEVQNILGFNVFKSPKPEYLISKLLEIGTNINDIVLDFHLGSGTTAAVAHKMGRCYIGIEQMDYIEDITVERLKKVIDGEQGGISKAVNWQGGGSFVYCELMENGNEIIREIENADEKTIKDIKAKIYKDERILPYITREELENLDSDFEELTLEDKKKALIRLIDKNKLYVNYSDVDSVDFDISEADKKFTKSFYEVD